MSYFTIANSLSVLRILCSFVMVYVANLGVYSWFYTCLAIVVISDILDGWSARYFKNSSEFGARLDSVADIIAVYGLAFCVYCLWPDKFLAQKQYMYLALIAYIFPVFIHYIKFGNIPSFHTVMAKIAAIFTLPVLLIWVLLDIEFIVPIYCVYIVLVSLEYTLITLWLQERKTDITSFLHLYFRMKNKE